MTLQATIPLDAIRVLLNPTEFADAAQFAYTVKDLTGTGSDVTTNITGLFDNAVDEETQQVIETAVEVLIANGTIRRVTMSTEAPDGVFVQDETLTGAPSGATATYAGLARGFLYYRPVSGGFTLSDVITGSDSGTKWTTHLSAPAVQTEGIAGPKAGDQFVTRGYRWQVDAVANEDKRGTYLLSGKRGALVP